MRVHSSSKRGLAAAVSLCLFALACSPAKLSTVPFYGLDGARFSLGADGENALAGNLPLVPGGKWKYSLPKPLAVPEGSALELEYRLEGAAPGYPVLAVQGEKAAWALPPDLGFLGVAASPSGVLRYRVPLYGKKLSSFQFSLKETEKTAAAASGSLRLVSLRLARRAYGYSVDARASFATPYVARETAKGVSVIRVEPPAEAQPTRPCRAVLSVGPRKGVLRAGTEAYQYLGVPGAFAPFALSFAAGSLPVEPFPMSWESAEAPRDFLVAEEAPGAFPNEPVTADPGLALSYRREAWRDARYEVFRWERFPSVLLFDTADYAVQERLFKRLAYFVEKAGYRGKLAADADIASLHGWNAHDYRAADLASFFETARASGFALNGEEKELQGILEAAGIVKRDGAGRLLAGEGAVVSVSRESESYLRVLFSNHECYHGIFFIDADFRRFCEERWKAFPKEDAKFLRVYFDSRAYDIRDPYLMTNEAMAYLLQQPLILTAKYFGETLPGRMEKIPWRAERLPPRTPGEFGWPLYAEDFAKEAAEYDAYVKMRWGLKAGSVYTVYQMSRTNAAR